MDGSGTIVESPLISTPTTMRNSGNPLPQSAPLSYNNSYKSRSPKSRATTSGGLSDPEEYSSAVAAAVANIVASAKAEDYRDAEDTYRLDEVTLESLPLDNLEPKPSNKVKSQKKGKPSSKAGKSKSKTKQAGVRRSATVRPTTTSRQDSLANLSVSLHNVSCFFLHSHE